MLNKAMVSGLVVVVVLVGGYFLLRGGGVPNEDLTGDAASTQDDKKMAFSEFVKQGGSYKCEVKQVVSDMENSGTVYISNGNIRGDYNTIAEGQTVKSSFILKDGTSYTWSDMVPIGFKMSVALDAAGDPDSSMSGNYGWDAEQIGDYNCEPWTADPSMFTPPSNVTFREVGDK